MDFLLALGAILACLWSIGCFFGPLALAVSMWMDEWERGFAVAIFFIGWPIGALLAVLPWGIYADSHDPRISLNKTEWVCMSRHSVTTTTYVMVGKVMTPITSTHQVCDQYNRK